MASFYLALTLLPLCSAALHQGVSWPSEQWGHPNATYDSAWANESLDVITAVGATHIRIIATAYVSWTGSPIVFTRNSSASPLRTATDAELRAAIQAARSRGLEVLLAPILDLDWDNSSNTRLWWATGSVSRGGIGANFSVDEWADFFASYTAWVMPLAQLAAEEGVSTFSVGDELDFVFLQVICAAMRWLVPLSETLATSAGGRHANTHLKCPFRVPWPTDGQFDRYNPCLYWMVGSRRLHWPLCLLASRRAYPHWGTTST